MIGGIYAEDLVWIVAVFILFFLSLVVYFSKSLSRLENFSQGGNMEIAEERRKNKLWWKRVVAIFFGYCQICEEKKALLSQMERERKTD